MAYEYSRADWAVIVIISEMFHGRICLNSVLLLLLVNFASGFRLKLMHISFLVSIRASLTHLHGFHLLLLLAIVHKNHFLCLYQQNKSSESKVKLKQTSNRCKRVPEAAKLAYANKTKEPIISQKLGCQDFWQIGNSALNKVKSAIPLLLNGLEVLSSVSDKEKVFAENFSKNSNLDDLGIYLSICFSF